MIYFLQHIAKHLYSEFGNTLNRHCLVFPNRRAGLFFLKYLANEIKQPVWTPSIMTISDLFRSLTTLKPAEDERLLFELYKTYREITRSSETFDDFFFWGDMLINDFDDVDKYLVDASKLFHNVKDIKEIDQQFGGLTDEQAGIIRRFWVNFNPEKETDQKQKFRSTWSILADLYTHFRKALKDKGVAYEGMIFRNVIEEEELHKKAENMWDLFHFIGFNAMNECEKALMSGLKAIGKARFYWDYDNSYMGGSKLNSAGYFMRGNIKRFGNDMPGEWSFNTFLSQSAAGVKRRIIDTSSDLAQVKLIPQLLAELPGLTPENAHETAVILADENLLMPVLSSLPDKIPDVNITMGYPLKHTSVYTLVRYLLDLQKTAVVRDNVIFFNHTEVIRILKHSLISGLIDEKDELIAGRLVEKNVVKVPARYFENSEVLSLIFMKPSSPTDVSEYLKTILLMIAAHREAETGDPYDFRIRNEFIYRVILAVNRLSCLTEEKDVSITLNTWLSLLDRLLRIQSVPFSGEPLTGIQIMGILETRALDFRNLLILSVNEGILPAITSGSSFIPFSLREAFGLPSINHRESVYAYHFFRLLHRAENVTFVYNSNPEGLRSGEMSRFLQQIKYSEKQNPEYINLGFNIRNHPAVSDMIERTDEHQEKLLSLFVSGKKAKYLSPSAINTWLNCRMKFYYRYICGLKEPEVITEEIDPAMLGSVLHGAMKNIYIGFAGRTVTEKDIEDIAGDRHVILNNIGRALNEILKRGNDAAVSGNELIINEVLMVYIRRILDSDRAYAPFTLIDLETHVRFGLKIRNDIGIIAGGNIDRVDRKGSVTRIVDYKTGAISDKLSSLGDLFEDDRTKDYDGWLQTLFYCEGYINGNQEHRVRPAVYKVKKAAQGEKDDILIIKAGKNEQTEVDDYEPVREDFIAGLTETVNRIFSPDEPFSMTSDQWRKCKYCPYIQLCMR